MKSNSLASLFLHSCLLVLWFANLSGSQVAAPLPHGVTAEWDMQKAVHETTPTRERICINGLWRWQPTAAQTDAVPESAWGYLKVPTPWPGKAGNYMWRETQTAYPHPEWENNDLATVSVAWYQREIEIPASWAGRRITVRTEYLNSSATVFLDGTKLGEIVFPGGELNITPACRPGGRHTLSLRVAALPLQALMQTTTDTNATRQVEAQVDLRGLCGDVWLASSPPETRIEDVKVNPSVRKNEIEFDVEVRNPAEQGGYLLRARILDGDRLVREIDSPRFSPQDMENGHFRFAKEWNPEKLWDIHTPHNTYTVQMTLFDSKALDEFHPVRFGFREFWIDGRDFYLNGSRIFCFAVPLDNAQVSAAAASYEGARESLRRLKTIGVNAVYTHNYGCEPGSHLGFEEVLRAADDEGMLVFFSLPHFSHYDWEAPDADAANGYARHTEFFIRQAQNHPAVVMYAMSHNSTGYEEDMNPEMMDGGPVHRDEWSARNLKRALRAETLAQRLDPSRIVYHHAGGNFGAVYSSNFYANFAPIQERSDWFEHWSLEGVKPLFLFEYGVPWGINWTLYRGWYQGKRDFGSAAVPWQLCMAEWNSQFLGDRAFALSEMDRENLRFEADQAEKGNLWHRWDYPHPVVSLHSPGFDNQEEVWAGYITDNWRAFRTWGVSGFNAWGFSSFWKLRDSVDKSRKDLDVDWDNLQKPGFSPDFIDRRYESIEAAYDLSDWIPTAAAEALLRNNQPLLAYIAGSPDRFTGKDHHFNPGQTAEKQIVVINNSREPVRCEWEWSLDTTDLPTDRGTVALETGNHVRIPVTLSLPATLPPGEYRLNATIRFDTVPAQSDSFTLHVLPPVSNTSPQAKIALFDPKGETAALLQSLHLTFEQIEADVDLSSYNLLIIGKQALTVDGPAPDIQRVRDGLKVIVFEQSSEVLEKRLGFRVQEYGLRRVFERIPDHPILAGLDGENLRDWNGEATLLPPRLEYELRPQHGPTVQWCGIDVARPWRCGNRGNVASVLIEKPAIGDFLPIVDGGFNLQYSPLLEYREGKGVILFCQMDVSGRSTDDPAAAQLASNLLDYASTFQPSARRDAFYAGEPAGFEYFKRAGLSLREYAGEDLPAEHVLIVSPGAGPELTASKGKIVRWLEAGGRLLAIGLDEREANAFLPFEISTKTSEHIDTIIEPAEMNSVFQGIGPSEVLNRIPRPIPLLTKGVRAIGDGVLASVSDENIVFSQLAPWHFTYEKVFHRKITYRRTGFLTARLLANLGVSASTPLLSRFSAPVTDQDENAPKNSDSSFQEGRWLQGLYLDQPEEMDDPYRFFRW